MCYRKFFARNCTLPELLWIFDTLRRVRGLCLMPLVIFGLHVATLGFMVICTFVLAAFLVRVRHHRRLQPRSFLRLTACAFNIPGLQKPRELCDVEEFISNDALMVWFALVLY